MQGNTSRTPYFTSEVECLINQNMKKCMTFSYPFLEMYVRHFLKAPLTVYDLETSNFRNTWNFGITEISTFHIFPNGKKWLFSTLINPEYPIYPRVAEKTGITDDMVSDKPLWKEAGAPFIDYLVRLGSTFLGYNNLGFDRGCIYDMNNTSQFTGLTPDEDHEIDIFPGVTLHAGKKTKLCDAVDMLDVDMSILKGGFHRAKFDVMATAGVADKLLSIYGPDILSLKKCTKKQMQTQKKLLLSRESSPRTRMWKKMTAQHITSCEYEAETTSH